MKSRLTIILVCALGFLSGCASADFRVADALQAGMTDTEAHAAVLSFGFERAERVERPSTGWPAEHGNFTALAWRAGKMEEQRKEVVSVAEYYPVHHGLLGAGQLFLFYGPDGKLLDFYRYQIN